MRACTRRGPIALMAAFSIALCIASSLLAVLAEESIADDDSNHFFCGLDWGTVSADCDAAQHCPSGNDDECTSPGAVCFGGTECDASRGDGQYFEYLGLASHDSRNKLFCT